MLHSNCILHLKFCTSHFPSLLYENRQKKSFFLLICIRNRCLICSELILRRKSIHLSLIYPFEQYFKYPCNYLLSSPSLNYGENLWFIAKQNNNAIAFNKSHRVRYCIYFKQIYLHCPTEHRIVLHNNLCTKQVT